jgi:hypothetical protein
MKTKTLTIASSAIIKEVNDAKLIATSPGCSRMARQNLPDDRERGGDHQYKYHWVPDPAKPYLPLWDYFILLG